MSESKVLEALALVGLYPGHEFRIAGSDTIYYIDKDYGIFTKNNDVISNEKLVTVLLNPSSITKCHAISQKEKGILKALYTLGFRYIARDINSNLYLYDLIPNKQKTSWGCDGDWLNIGGLPCFSGETDFKYIRWEDKKPFDIKAFLECEGYEI
ncbi:MAG: hypothetical protein KH020_05360 [Clostridiales bacterium]|nr:hypothetical protein [Clostridiales bacterium]